MFFIVIQFKSAPLNALPSILSPELGIQLKRTLGQRLVEETSPGRAWIIEWALKLISEHKLNTILKTDRIWKFQFPPKMKPGWNYQPKSKRKGNILLSFGWNKTEKETREYTKDMYELGQEVWEYDVEQQ